MLGQSYSHALDVFFIFSIFHGVWSEVRIAEHRTEKYCLYFVHFGFFSGYGEKCVARQTEIHSEGENI